MLYEENELAHALGFSGGSPAVSGVPIDSRTLERGDAFFALKGERFDASRLRDKGVAYEEIGERKLAIEHALGEMEAGDVVIVAGKGHEQGQLKGKTLIPFDDAAVVRELLARMDCSALEKS